MRMRLALVSAIVLFLSGLALVYFWSRPFGAMLGLDATFGWDDSSTIEDVTEYQAPTPEPADELADDQLTDKNPPFIADLIDRRPEGAWQLNSSAAVLRVDTPMLKPDADADLLELRASYADAIAKAHGRMTVLPSINMIDGKAKQFDDGLFAAIDLACYKGESPGLESPLSVIKRLDERVSPESAASAYLAAGLKTAGAPAKTIQADQAAAWLSRFETDAMSSKPFSFYTWSEELSRVFRFMRFFQQRLPLDQPGLIADLARAVGSDAKLLADYKRVNSFYAKLTNPLDDLTLANVLERGGSRPATQAVAIFPGSGSKETELFRRLFPLGLPPSANLMRELLKAIRSGKIDLAPRPGSGWYEHQIYALEILLAPEKGAEDSKLLLTKAYKKRMLEAFEALMTKRRETHARTLDVVKGAVDLAPPPAKLKPRLRVEPCPSYYLRTARSYDFLLSFLLATLGEDRLVSLHGLKEGGQRSKALIDELRWMRQLFYGLHLLSAEDIGMAPALRADEPVDRAASEATASDWLAAYSHDTDLEVDSRVSVPIYFDVPNRQTRLWATIGVRLARLSVSYAKPPKIRAASDGVDWQEAALGQLEPAEYVIAVDEFAEAEIAGLEPLTREEFRNVCNASKTRPEILEALRRRRP
jgi:hypothetical protein